MTVQEAISQRRSCRSFSTESLSLGTLQRLLWSGQGNTSTSGHLAAPSAEALYPLRLFVSVGRVERCDSGLFEVAAGSSDLTPLCHSDPRPELERCAIGNQPWVSQSACVISICADLVTPAHAFAEQPPYGNRGTRYVYIEAGAAAQNIALQASAERVGCVLVAGFRDHETAQALKLEAPYMPILHLCLGVPAEYNAAVRT